MNDKPIPIMRTPNKLSKINYNSYMDLNNLKYLSKEKDSILFYFTNGEERWEHYEGIESANNWFNKILKYLELEG